MESLNEKLVGLAEETVKEIFIKMGIGAKSNTRIVTEGDKEALIVNIETPNPNILIGQEGVNLQALQHLARLLLRKRADSSVYLIVDINNYKQNKLIYLKKLAISLARKAEKDKKEIILKPMSAYERRIIHTVLACEESVKTESFGEEPQRRIVIKPKEK